MRPSLSLITVPGSAGARLLDVSSGYVRPWEFNGWKRESMAWKTGCYIHAGLSRPFGQIIFRGRDVVEFFESISVNGYKKFPVGSVKHAVMCDDNGLIASHGVLQHNGPEEVQLFVSGNWASYQQHITSLDVEQTIVDNFLFQIAGPTSLEVMEKAAGESLRDIAFLRFRNASIAGKRVEILRVGMAGTLAYEVHGDIGDGDEVYAEIVKSGENLGLERLGFRTYTVNHIEGGFPQTIWTFSSSAAEDAGYAAYIASLNPIATPPPSRSGSVDPANMRARYRTPWEVGWEKMVKFDHDFIGRKALEDEAKDPQRTIVTLLWDAEDVIDIYASLLRPGPEYKTIDLPTSPHLFGTLAHADHVLKGDRPVGMSSGTAYSYYFRQVISHATIDIDQAQIGNQVIVQWGDHGGTIKHVRATVERYPYLNMTRNQDIDVNR